MLFENALISVQSCEDPQHAVIQSTSVIAIYFQASGWSKFWLFAHRNQLVWLYTYGGKCSTVFAAVYFLGWSTLSVLDRSKVL